ncbi:MAG: hypothetical protein DRP66_07605 [Planctomycetota bacterium]|nr:MAG: hypothetical protein DRP66_07605 [Planctomycetota bacterium]
MKDVWAIVLTTVLIVACLLLPPGCGGANVAADPVNAVAGEPAASRRSAAAQQTVDQPPIEQQWGIEIQALRLSAADNMLDFRYRVTDPGKARQLLKRGLKPYLLDRATGAKLLMPTETKIGPLRQATLAPKKDRVYYVMFANPGRFIKRGAVVDVVIGDFVAKDIAVQ